MAKPSEAKEPAGAPFASSDLETATRGWGEKLLSLIDAAHTPSLFSKKGLYGNLMEWSMRDEHFKTQLFRFVDVLPTLNSSGEIARHLQEYLGDDRVQLSPALKLGLKAAGGMSWLLGTGVKAQITGLARQFMLGDDEKEIVTTLRRLNQEDIAFTVDVLGEAVVSEAEADQYTRRYLELMHVLAREVSKWQHPCKSNESARGRVPPLNLSVKISALYSQIRPEAPETAIEEISQRMRAILRQAKELGAFINFDMESYALKDLTLRLFRTIFAEPEFRDGPACGLALQAYLRDSEADLRALLAWGKEHGRRFTVRLVKGAYWDYETIVARQRHWPVPVFGQKAETDENFEALSTVLLENLEVAEAAFGTHNVRSIAHILAQAEKLGVGRRDFEFQMLYGMADSLKSAVLGLGYRLREYCPVGELLPGMAYLVRRLLENTSNEGFLANKFGKGADAQQLLRAPGEATGEIRNPRSENRNEFKGAAIFETGKSDRSPTAGDLAASSFMNEPHTDFNIASERKGLSQAISDLRAQLGKRHPLVINNRTVSTPDWSPSVNPANLNEVIGLAAQATIAEADAALSAARIAQPAWGRTPPEQRALLLEKVAALMQRDKAALCALEILEAGKNWAEADADVAESIDFCRFYATVMRDLGQLKLTQQVAGETNLQHWWPRGVGVIIAPWNFPLAILTGMTAAAVVTGNTAIMKPSDQTPVTAGRLMELFIEAGAPPGVVNLLTGPGRTIGEHLTTHAQIDLIAFTGSKEVGLKIWETAARPQPGQRNLKKVVCEMGGKNCVIVDSDADLDEAVAGVIASAFGYQGQKCSALSRLVVLEDNYDRFMKRLVAAAASLRVGPPEMPGNAFGPVISEGAQQKILAAIETGKAEAHLVWQGTVPADEKACYVPPTIFEDVPASSRLFREEIFGPVLAVSKAKDFEHALALANESEFALTGGCYSRSPKNIERTKAEFVCGNLYINRTTTGAIVERQPFGGFKMSGGGTKAGGREYLENFMVPRVITENCLRRGFAPEET